MSDKQVLTQSDSHGRHVARATTILSLLTTASRVLGLIRDMVVANYFGAGMVSDAFFVAFKVPNLLRRLVAEGCLTTAFVPIFTEELAHSPERARKAVRATTGFSLLITTILAILGIIYSDDITLLFAPGFSLDQEKGALASSLMRVMFPYIIIVSLLALAASILNCLGKFALPALAPIDLNISAIAAVLLVAPFFEKPIYVLACSVLVGGVLGLAPQMLVLKRLGYPLVPANPFGSSPVKRLMKLMIPAVVSSSIYQLMIFINTSLASLLDEGSVSWLFYADRLFQFPLGVFSLAVAAALLPTLSKFAAQKNETALSHQLHLALGWNTFITLPSTVGLIILSEPLVRVIFEHGTFTHHDSGPTAAALAAYCVGLWATSGQSILVRVFLAKKNSIIPAWTSTITIFANMLLAAALMGKPTQIGNTSFSIAVAHACSFLAIANLRHVGLALAGSLASFLSLTLTTLMLPRVGTHIQYVRVTKDFLRIGIASIAMGASILALEKLQLRDIYFVLCSIPIGLLVFLLSAAVLGDEHCKIIAETTRTLFKRYRNRA